jgi:hypothetical protein
MHIHTTHDIAASAEAVFAALLAFADYGDWNPLSYRVSGTPAEGELVELRVKLGGQKMKRTHRISRVQAPTETEPGDLCWTIISATPWLMRGERCQRVIPTGPQSCRYENDERVEGLAGPIVGLFFGAKVRAGIEAIGPALATYVGG